MVGAGDTAPISTEAAGGQVGSWEGQEGRTVHALEKGMLLQAYCEICREHLELAGRGKTELGDVGQACERLEAQLGAVKAELASERFRVLDAAMAERLCTRIDDFVQSFAKAVGRRDHQEAAAAAAPP